MTAAKEFGNRRWPLPLGCGVAVRPTYGYAYGYATAYAYGYGYAVRLVADDSDVRQRFFFGINHITHVTLENIFMDTILDKQTYSNPRKL